MSELNILIVGVSGQGSLLASRILGSYCCAKGLDVKVSEVHGMSQRGGSVVTYVRAGERIDSPLIEQGGADVIISFEELEAFRYVGYLKKGGRVIANSQRIEPMPVIMGSAVYPENIPEKLADLGAEAVFIDALSLALDAGSAKAANVVMLGAASKYLGGSEEEWLAAVEKCVPARFLEMNKRAFLLGKDI